MPKYAYKAKKSPREIVEGTVVADNKSIAIQKVSSMGYYILSLEEYEKTKKALEKRRNIFAPKVSLNDLTNFTRQLSDLLESGLTIVKALEVLQNQTQNKRLKEIIADVKNTCVDGYALSSALGRHPQVFSDLYTSMIRSGEASGALGIILNRLADFNDRRLDIQTKLRSAMAYPILMAIVGAGTIIVLLTFVIPKMMTLFGDLGQNLPLPTLLLIRLNKIITTYWWLMGLAIAAIVFFFWNMYRLKEGRMAIDRFKLNMPVFGGLVKKVEIARFSRTLATLLENGVPVLDALKIVAQTVNNHVIKEEILKTAESVKDGSNVAAGLSKSGIIPPLVINMISVGEETGQLEKALAKVAASYDRESDSAIKIMMSLLEPLMILGLGLIVGFIVIAMLLPVFEINFLAR